MSASVSNNKMTNRDISNVNIELNNSNKSIAGKKDKKKEENSFLMIDTRFFKIPYQLHTRWCISTLIINIFLPGIGTILAGCSFVQMGMKLEDAEKIRCFYYGRGLLQLLLAILIVGWIWAIITSCYLLKASMMDKESKQAG